METYREKALERMMLANDAVEERLSNILMENALIYAVLYVADRIDTIIGQIEDGKVK